MKIDPNLIIGAVAGKMTETRQAPVGGALFEDVLQGVQETGVKEASRVQAAYPIDLVNPQKIGALSLSEQALDMLDAYSKGLADPSLSLKSIEPMVEDLSRMSSELSNAGSFLSDADPLKGIIDEVASTVNSEVMRFRRGDLLG